MSHAEAFGKLRSFMAGLETKARDLRKVLESSRDEDGKWVNGKDGTGIGERCSRGERERGTKRVGDIALPVKSKNFGSTWFQLCVRTRWREHYTQ